MVVIHHLDIQTCTAQNCSESCIATFRWCCDHFHQATYMPIYMPHHNLLLLWRAILPTEWRSGHGISIIINCHQHFYGTFWKDSYADSKQCTINVASICGWHFLIMALWTGRAQSVSEAHQQHMTIHPVYLGGRRWWKDLLSWCTGCEGQWRSTVNQLTLTGTLITNRTIHITSRQVLSELWWDDANKSAIPQRLQIMNGTT